MGFYYDKLIAVQESDVEKAVEDSIQTPNDVGVDLNHVEDVIAGDDGIEAHKEEIEDAMEGIVGDPLDECMIIMYESEYNFNQLMKCIGIEELNEFAQGRDFVLEGFNLKALIENAKKILKGMWEKAKNLFNNIIDKIDQMANVNKALVKTKEKEIIAGFNSGKWEPMWGYYFSNMDVKYRPHTLMLADTLNNNPDLLPKSGKVYYTLLSPKYTDNTSNVSQAIEKFKTEHLQHRLYTPENSSAALNQVLKILKEDKGSVELRQMYRKLDDEYKTILSDMDRLESEINDDKKDRIPELIKLLQEERNIQNLYFNACYNICKARASQAREFALAWIEAAKSNGKEEPKDDQNKSSEKNNFDHDDSSFEGSIKKAKAAGVPEDKILKNKEDIDKYFTEK